MELEKALERYDKKAFTHNYIIVAKRWKQTNAYFVDWNTIKPFIVLDGNKLRLNLTTHAIKTLHMKAWQVVPLGGEYAIENETERLNKHGKKYNKGNGAESLVLEKYGQVWTWDNVPYTDGPDVWIDGVPYQVKTYRATFTKIESL